MKKVCTSIRIGSAIDSIGAKRIVLDFNEFPFIITNSGIFVMPITSLSLAHQVLNERVSTGIAGLDEMMNGEGYYRGTSVYVTGTAGTGKSSIAASFVAAACERGEACIYFAFEESPDQIMRNMNSIGINLEHYVKKRTKASSPVGLFITQTR